MYAFRWLMSVFVVLLRSEVVCMLVSLSVQDLLSVGGASARARGLE